MKYYIYISDTKVDMLYSQIPRKLLQGIAGELKMNLGVIATSLKQAASEETRFSKVELIKRYLEKNEPIGTIDLPSKWIYGEVRLRWGGYDDGQVVYFGGTTKETVFGFGGSAHHVIGAVGKSHAGSHSATPYLLAALAKELKIKLPPVDYCDGWNPDLSRPKLSLAALDAVDLASTQMDGPVQRVEILAKKLLSGSRAADDDGYPQTKILLGTPLYVALLE